MGTEIDVLRWSASDLEVMAKNVARSRLFGLDEAQAFTLMLLAQAEGIHPIQAVRRYHVIQGRPAMKADAMLADMLRRGWVVKWHTEINDGTKQEATFTHAIKCPDGKKIAFTIDDAKKADLTKNDMYRKYPANMLRSRMISNACRALDPEIVAGIYTPEEVQDFEPEPTKPHHAVNHDNSSGHGSGAYASPETIRRYQDWLTAQIEAKNQLWLDHLTDPKTGEVDQSAPDPFDPKNFAWRLSGHLLKWAREQKLINAPDDIRAGQRDKFAALAWERHYDAIETEARMYCRQVWREAEAARKAKQVTDEAAEDAALDALAKTGTDLDVWPEGRE